MVHHPVPMKGACRGAYFTDTIQWLVGIGTDDWVIFQSKVAFAALFKVYILSSLDMIVCPFVFAWYLNGLLWGKVWCQESSRLRH